MSRGTIHTYIERTEKYKEHQDSEQHSVDHTKCCPLWGLNPNHLGQCFFKHQTILASIYP